MYVCVYVYICICMCTFIMSMMHFPFVVELLLSNSSTAVEICNGKKRKRIIQCLEITRL